MILCLDAEHFFHFRSTCPPPKPVFDDWSPPRVPPKNAEVDLQFSNRPFQRQPDGSRRHGIRHQMGSVADPCREKKHPDLYVNDSCAFRKAATQDRQPLLLKLTGNLVAHGSMTLVNPISAFWSFYRRRDLYRTPEGLKE